MAAREKENTETLIGILAFPGKDLPTQYKNIVRSRWVYSYKKENDYMRVVHSASYQFAYSNYVALIMNREKVVIRIAALEEDDDVVLGFSVVEGNVLHYVHVPRAYRRRHIGTMLIPDGIEWFTHITKIGFQIWSTKGPNANFNPFI